MKSLHNMFPMNEVVVSQEDRVEVGAIVELDDQDLLLVSGGRNRTGDVIVVTG
jgi:hypothetical protein